MNIGSVVSEVVPLDCGVPQGSVLGPVLFSLYTTPLEDIILRHGLKYMLYADDTQLYITCKKGMTPIEDIESCISDIRQWMRNNMLALNDSKTEVIHFSSKFSARSSASPCSVRIGGVDVAPSNTVRNLGVTFDNSCAMSTRVTNICRSASFALWKIAKIRNVLDEKSAIKLIHAFVTSRLDYCNSLLVGLPLYGIPN